MVWPRNDGASVNFISAGASAGSAFISARLKEPLRRLPQIISTLLICTSFHSGRTPGCAVRVGSSRVAKSLADDLARFSVCKNLGRESQPSLRGLNPRGPVEHRHLQSF